MNRFKRYALILEHSPEALVRTVTTAMAKGWIPTGGVSMAEEVVGNEKAKSRRMTFAQAVVLPFTPQDAYGLGEKEEDIRIPGAHMVKDHVPLVLAPELRVDG